MSLLEDDSDNGCDHGIAENCEFLCRPYKCNVGAFDKRPCCKAPAVCHESLIFLHVASSAQESKGEAERQAHGLILRFKNQTANEFQRIGSGVLLETIKTSEIWLSRILTIV